MAELQNPFGELPPIVEKEPLRFTDNFAAIESALIALPRGHSDAYLNLKSQELGLIRRAADQTVDAGLAYSESIKDLTISPSVLDTMQAHQTMYGQRMTSEIRNIIRKDVARDSSLLSTYQPTLDNMDATERLYDGLQGAQKILADTYSKESPLSRSVREKEVKGYAFSLYQEWAEERGVLDKVVDVGGLLIDPMSFTLDANDLVTRINPEAKGDALDNFTKVVASYQVLDPELKARVLPDLIAQATEAYDNNEFKVGAFVGLLHSPSYFTESFATGVLESVEVGTLLATAPLTGSYRAAKAIQQGMSIRQKLKAYGNSSEAVNATKGTRNPVDEAMDADATNWEKTLVGTNATDDLAPEYQRIAEQIKKEVSQPIDELAQEDSFVKVDALKPAEKEAAKKNYVEALRSDKNPHIMNAEVIADDAKGFTVRYQVDNGDGTLIMKRDVKWSADDAGSLIAEDGQMAKSSAAVLGGKLLSPETVLRSFDDTIVQDVTFGGLQSATLRKGLGDVWKATEKGINHKSKVAVDELLIAGDEFVDAAGKRGTVFKPGDLLSGNVQTLSGKRKYSMDEVKAYYAKRAFFDESHRLQNHIVREKLEFQGFKEAKWTNPLNDIEETQIVKPFKDGRGWTTDRTETIMAPGLAGDAISLTKRGAIDVADAIANGYVPVKFFKPIKINGEKVTHGLIPQGGKGLIKDLPQQVLNKTEGYVPRISKPGYYYVKDVNDGNRTVARFKTKQAAEQYSANEMARASSTNVPAGDVPNLQAFRDRDFTALDAIDEDASTFGGLYTGARNRQGIFEGEELANEMSRMSAGQSVQRMVESISTQMPLNEYRVAVVKRWKESAKQALKNQGLQDTAVARAIDSADEWKDVPLNMISDNTTRKMLESHRTYIIDSLKIPMNQENAWSNFMMNIADTLPNSKVRDLTVKIASTNPMQALKGATFDAYLGWFNPRQLYVQTQNAALAASMYPKQALGAVKDAFVQRTMLYTPTVDRELLRKAAKGMDTDVSDMAESLEQFKRSGLRDGVMRTGDYDANLGGFSTGTIEGYRKIAAKGRVFFEEGESFARLISWNIARKNWKAANPGKAIDDKAIRAITDDTLRMNMNMQRENAAWWQKNALTAVPTQFLQVQAKLIENVVGGIFTKNGRWTQKEAGMAFFGQLALYGTVGVPMVEQIMGAVKEGVSGEESLFNENNPNWSKGIDRGLVGVFTSGLGFDNNFSEPGSIIAGLDDNIVWDGIKSFGEMVKGESQDISFSAPSIGVLQRKGDAMMKTYEAVRDLVVAPTLETAGDSVLKTMDSWAAVTSTWSNARKMVFLHKLGGITDKRGNIMLSLENLEDTNFVSLTAKAMGIPLYKEGAYYEQKMFNFDTKKAQQDTRKALRKVYNEYKIDGNLEKFKANQAMLMSEYEDQPIVRQDIINRFIKEVGEQRSGLDRELYRWMNDYVKSSGQIGSPGFRSNFTKQPDSE